MRGWEPRAAGRHYTMRGRAGAKRAGAVAESAPVEAEREGAVAERALAGAERAGAREGTGGCDSRSVT